MFKELIIEGWRQFQDIDITFHDRLTVLTGANGTGKTTLLNLLNRHFGWDLQFVSTPSIKKRGVLQYLTDIWYGRSRKRNPEKEKATLVSEMETPYDSND